MPKRRLEDLWVVGRFEEFDDGKGEPVKVWLQKLSPVDTGAALRRANAARARVKTLKQDRESDDFQDIWLEVLGWEDKDSLVAYLVVERQVRIEERVEAELAGEEEWANEGYLQGLRDSWAGGLEDAHIADPDSPEGQDAERVLAELTRFAGVAEQRCQPEIEAAKAELATRSIEDLREMALDRIINYRASEAWMEEFHRCELFYGVHPAENPRARYWRQRAELDALSGEVLNRLYMVYADLSVDVVEGKGSGETPISSGSSEPPPEPAMGESSGLVAVSP